MKAKLVSTAILLLVIGLLKSDATFEGYSIVINSPDEENEYYDPETYYSNASTTDTESDDPEVYYCDTSVSSDEYPESIEEPKYQTRDEMYGAFKIITKPKGADINLYDADMYLSTSPTPVYPVVMDESMEVKEGIPGRTITLMITKKGYKPMKKDIFVPFMYESQTRAIDNPTVFKINLKRDNSQSNVSICFYYSYGNRHHRFRHHHNWFGPPSHLPWCPPGYIGWFYPPRPPHHGWGHPTPPPPGGGHHGGNGHNPPPPPPPPGGGHHNPPNGNGNNPPSGNIGNTTPSGINPQVKPNGEKPVGIITPRPDDSGGNTWGTNPGTNINLVSSTVKPRPEAKPDQPAVVSKPNVQSKPVSGNPVEKPKPVTIKPVQKPNPGSVKPVEKPKPVVQPNLESEKPVQKPNPVSVKPVEKPKPRVEVKPDHREKTPIQPKPKPEVKKDKVEKDQSKPKVEPESKTKDKNGETEKKIVKLVSK